MKEIWMPVKGYEALYEVSNTGLVRSKKRLQKHSKTGKLFIKQSRYISIRKGVALNGYSNVMLSKEGKQNSLFHHRVIAEAFIPNPHNKPCVNHKNGIKTDNRIKNLEWVTKSENSKHSFKIGLQSNKGEKHPRHKFTLEDIYAIRLAYKAGFSSWKIYKEYYPCMSYTNIKDIIAKRTWA